MDTVFVGFLGLLLGIAVVVIWLSLLVFVVCTGLSLVVSVFDDDIVGGFFSFIGGLAVLIIGGSVLFYPFTFLDSDNGDKPDTVIVKTQDGKELS